MLKFWKGSEVQIYSPKISTTTPQFQQLLILRFKFSFPNFGRLNFKLRNVFVNCIFINSINLKRGIDIVSGHNLREGSSGDLPGLSVLLDNHNPPDDLCFFLILDCSSCSKGVLLKWYHSLMPRSTPSEN